MEDSIKSPNAVKIMNGFFETDSIVVTEISSIEKRGKWIDNGDCEYLCSECGMSLLFEPHYNFCPNCGADMRGN
jgi:rubrerythrin